MSGVTHMPVRSGTVSGGRTRDNCPSAWRSRSCCRTRMWSRSSAALARSVSWLSTVVSSPARASWRRGGGTQRRVSYAVHQPHDMKHHVPSVARRPGRRTPARGVPRSRARSWCRSTGTGADARSSGTRSSWAAHADRSPSTWPGGCARHCRRSTVVDDPEAIPPDLRGLDPRNPVNLAVAEACSSSCRRGCG